MIVIFWSIAYKIIEFVSTLYTSKLFIYEELIQGATLQCFILTLTDYRGDPTPIVKKAYYYGFLPAYSTMKAYWYLAPWVYDPFAYFFNASELGLTIFMDIA